MKKTVYIIISLLLFSFLLGGCTEPAFEGETIGTTVVSMSIPKDSIKLIDSDSLQSYAFTKDDYSVTLFLASDEGTPLDITTFTDDDYRALASEEETEIRNAFSANEALTNGVVEIPDTYETVKVGGYGAIKISASIKGEAASGFITIYLTGNESDSVLIYFITQTEAAYDAPPEIIDQMIGTVAYKIIE